MAEKKAARTGRYVVLRDYGEYLAGDVIDLDPGDAADLVRDGMVAPAED